MSNNQKEKITDITLCPYWDEMIGCWNCPRFDNEKGKKEICPFHKNQTYESQKKALWIIDKIKLNADFGKFISEKKRLRIRL